LRTRHCSKPCRTAGPWRGPAGRRDGTG
jgi:hypothetical protein